MACRFVGLNPKDMNFAKPEKVLEVARPDVEPETTPNITPDVTSEKKTSRKPRAEAKHK